MENVLRQQVIGEPEDGREITQSGFKPRIEPCDSGIPARKVTAEPRLLGVRVPSATLQRFGLMPEHREVHPCSNPWKTGLLQKLTGSQLIKKFPAFY
jgi:hypothetical protein